VLGHALGATHPVGIESVPDSELREILYKNPLFLPNGNRPQDWKKIVENDFGSIVPTSGNPPHAGHYGMAKEMARAQGLPSLFSVTADSVHKPALTVPELLQRVSYFRSENIPVVLTQKDPLFIDKARQFRSKVFGIGTDTLERMLDPKWSTQPVADMLAEFWECETSFVVFNRNGQNAKEILDKLLPRGGRDFRSLFEVHFMTWDVSSTQLRAITAS
jgi:nicotinic acid mononucleotide adenylyltransferase